ncbi:telomerase protein component 1-like [Gastrophryne carolinensis]
MGIVLGRKPAQRDRDQQKEKYPAEDLAQMWDAINNLPPQSRSPALPLSSGWATVRVFVSSTFDDFHSEREVLVKQVFPELRDWCEAHSMCLVECDLRWGIPKDTPSGKILATCLGELDRCHQDTSGIPLMVVLLGERAGWIPQAADVPQPVVAEYNWINGMSVTGAEIIHGAYRNHNPNAAFCLRDPSFTTKLPLQQHSRYQDQGYQALFMQSLKEQVCHRFPKEQILKYHCRVLGADCSTGIEKVKLGFSDEFSSWILEFLKTRILKTFPEHIEMVTPERQLSWQKTELNPHQLFLHQKQQLFLGRDLEIQKILDFFYLDPAVDDPCNNTSPTDWSSLLFQVTSQPGLGKSSLLAAIISRMLQSTPDNVFYHFVGCCSSSVQLSNIVMRLCCHLMPDGPECEDVLVKVKNCWRNEEMKDVLQQALQETNTPIYVFIDAVNQLSHTSDASDLLSWLSTPGFLPHYCKCVISCTSTSALCNSPPPYCLCLDLLPSDTAQKLATMYLSRYSKSLGLEQLHLLVKKHSSANPLWLSLACEELRIFGVFEMLTKKIMELPDSLQGLLESIIQRLVQEDQSSQVKQLLCLLHCCQDGVLQSDLQGALAFLNGGVTLPIMHWASICRTVSSLLQVGRDFRGRDTFSFFHSSVAQAVEKCLLSRDNSRELYLVSLADYYEHKCTDDSTVIYQLPHLLQKANLNSRLVHFLRKDLRGRSIPAHTQARYLKALRCFHPCRVGFPRSAAMICGMCSLKIGGFGQLFPNNKSCVLCGIHVTIMGKEAFICPQHSRPGRSECLVCRAPILGVPPPSPALLCHMCGFFETCVAINL